MIPHAAPGAIGALMVSVIEAPFPTALMAGLGGLHRAPAGQGPATHRAVGVAYGRTPDRSRRGGRTSGRSFGGGGGGAGPRGRSPRGDFRLDGEPKPWHNRSDWLGLSEFEAVTRVRRHPGPHLVCVPPVRYPKDRVDTTAGAMDAAAGADAHDAPTPACKTARRAVSHKRPQPVIFLLTKNPKNPKTVPTLRHASRLAHFHVTANTVS